MDRSVSEKNDGRVFCAAFDVTQTAEAGGELTMPDYYPEIRRVVSVTATALPDSKFISEGNLEVGGTLAFTLLYIGDDGALTSVPYCSEYTHKVPIGRDFQGGSSDIRTESVAEAVTCRPLAPRTVSLRAKVKSRMCADKGEDCTPVFEREDSSPLASAERRTLERLEREVPTVSQKCFSSTGSVTGEESGHVGDSPILCHGKVLINDVKAGNDSVTVTGELFVSCLILTAEGVYKTVYHSLPIEERITAEGISPDHLCAAHGRATSVTVNAGEDGTLEFDGEYDIDAVCAQRRNLTVTDDIYSTQYTLSANRRDMDALSLICLENGKISLSGEGRRKSPRGEGDHIIESLADARIERVDISDGKANFSGACTFKALIASGGEVAVEEFEVPVKYECPAAEASSTKDCIWHAHATPARAECRIEDTKITGRCELYIYAEALRETKLSPVTKVTVGEKSAEIGDSAIVRICYPEAGKRIWDIAKECRATLGECERTNRVTRYDLSDGTPLIIK